MPPSKPTPPRGAKPSAASQETMTPPFSDDAWQTESDCLTVIKGTAPDAALSPLASGVNSGSSQSSQPSTGQYYSTQLAGQWPTPGGGSGPYNFSNPASHGSGALVQPFSHNRSMYTQQPQYGARPTASPATTDSLPPPYSGDLPAFQTPLPSSGSAGAPQSAGLPSHAPQTVLSSQSLSSHPPTPVSVPPSTETYQRSVSSSAIPTDGYRGVAAPANQTSYYAPSSTPQQSSFPSYAPAQPSPTHQPSPTTSGIPTSRGLSSIAGHVSGMAAPNIGYGAPRPQTTPSYGYHQLPNVGNGPVMSNLGAPGGQMALVPGMGMNAGYVQSPHGHLAHHHLYGHGSQTQQQADRPFKCDQCPQSFNRNHDLKRHKRIHLAVKPFPCTFCEKSFSRKDALKVRRSPFVRRARWPEALTDMRTRGIALSKVVATRRRTAPPMATQAAPRRIAITRTVQTTALIKQRRRHEIHWRHCSMRPTMSPRAHHILLPERREMAVYGAFLRRTQYSTIAGIFGKTKSLD
jgi:hypothetical protein